MIDLRLLRYFLEISREGNITRAADKLHITQPTLSRQISALEESLGKKLYVRTNYGIRLTEEGLLLRKRAEEMTELEEKILSELSGDDIHGTVYIGAGETAGVKYLARVLKVIRGKYPGIKYRMISGDSEDVSGKLDKGLIDFGLFIGKVNLKKYDCIALPDSDSWGVVMRRDDELALKDYVSPDDLRGRALLFSHQAKSQGEFSEWLGYPIDELDIIGTHNLVYNASVMVREGLGIIVTIEGIVNTGEGSGLKFVPLKPEIKACLTVAWNQENVFTKSAKKFLDELIASTLQGHQE